MTRAHARLAALERQARRDDSITVWRQDPTGADAYTNPRHPDKVLTAAQLHARSEPAGATRIVVYRGERTPNHA